VDDDDDDDDDDNGTPGLKDGFDWYMSPADKAKYEEIYAANKDRRGEIQCTFSHPFHPHSFLPAVRPTRPYPPPARPTNRLTPKKPVDSLDPLYSSLDVPATDLRSAWTLINPSAAPTIAHDAALAFLHLLNNRHAGYRLPATVPPSLRASFDRRSHVDYRLDDRAQQQPAAAETSSGRKAKFGDTYLSRLGVGGKSSYRPVGTDFSSSASASATPTTTAAKTPDEDWEEVRLKKQLADLESQIAAVEGSQRRSTSAASASRRERSKPALVKRELEQLLEYKRKEKRDLDDGEGSSKAGAGLKGLSEEIAAVREQVEGLEAHAARRRSALERVRGEVEEERGGR